MQPARTECRAGFLSKSTLPVESEAGTVAVNVNRAVIVVIAMAETVIIVIIVSAMTTVTTVTCVATRAAVSPARRGRGWIVATAGRRGR